MNRIFQTSMLGALVVAGGLALAPAGSSAQSPDQVRQMSVEQLQQRQQVLQGELDNGGGKKEKRLLRRVQRELKNREKQAAQPQPAQQQQQPAQQQQAQPQRQQQPTQQQQAQPQRQQQPAQQQQAQPQRQQQGDDGNVNRQARQYLRNNENVRRMDDNQLQTQIRDGRNLLQQGGLRGRLERQVQNLVQTAQSELDRRSNVTRQPTQQSSGNNNTRNDSTAGRNTDAEARELLADNRPASSLRDPQLRRRLEQARRVLGDRDLNRRLFKDVRSMVRADRDELRSRVARGDENRAERRNDRQDARQLLGDRRDASDLNDRQLQARIKSARDLLSTGSLRPGEKDRLQDMMREARGEKRRRLIAGRADRRERLRRNRNNNQIVIQIPSIRIGPDRDDIDAAEANDELLEQQLVAPPRRRIDRKFTRQDFRNGRPSSRDSMPAIEVDTIHFGFNESFVREEEIPQLERIGEIIERIIAANPDEVFLIEGHTDAVGSAAYNESLSSKRADAVRDAMLQFFNIERTNLETVGYGEEFLKIETEEEEPANRRVTIRRITPLLASQ